jgi:glycosyltransferase involved in cell wall biosynthesis
MNEKKLSIIVPIYGVEKYLRQCIDSIVAQVFKEFECILVDDGSKDGCPEICDEYALKDKRFKVIHKQNAGYGAAINTGLDIAKGKWIGIVEPDDWIEESAYSFLMAESDDDCVDIIKGNFYGIHDNAERQIYQWTIKPPLSQRFVIKDYALFLNHHPSIWSAIYRKSFLDKFAIRMKEVPGAGWTDNPFLVETMCQARGIVYVDKPIYNYRVGPSDVIALKGNWHIPYDRMMEIHNWFVENDISDAMILCARYEMHLCYLYTMSLCANGQNRVELSKAIRACAKSFDNKAVFRSGLVPLSVKLSVFNYRYLTRFRMYRNVHPFFNRCCCLFERCYGWILVSVYSILVDCGEHTRWNKKHYA